MNSAMEPQKLEYRYSFGDAEAGRGVGFRYLGRTMFVGEQKFEIGATRNEFSAAVETQEHRK
jgi:hypothetical protein